MKTGAAIPGGAAASGLNGHQNCDAPGGGSIEARGEACYFWRGLCSGMRRRRVLMLAGVAAPLAGWIGAGSKPGATFGGGFAQACGGLGP